ncbi:sulfotransferase [Gracilibacillus thailandensis]|uniref:Sulfotransferase n=1 Tax=Gracilibacillus thailandensis TaxID=563735 RepID=A0A6N7QXZ2_9BACI|nr:sulfotransferase [Gracilibacillus thailandensis]MRI67033.1 sulfotransferase [Gracilibacillus thailandensis]
MSTSDEIREIQFEKNMDLEDLLNEVNSDLRSSEERLLSDVATKYPIIFVVGPLRSGSTLMLQWLASTKQFSYPSNLLSRFYGAPIIGAKIQRLLTDPKFNFRNEILDFQSSIDFVSENGKTKGAISPNEFWYFWRRFLPFKDIDYLPDDILFDQVDIDAFKNELYGISNVFEKPFALKAMICNYNIEFLNELFEKAIFIYIKRDPYTNIESALKARERQLGSRELWYSFKIPEYYELKKINDPVKQTAGQIYCINRAVEKGLAKVPKNKKLVVKYEEFCEDPEKIYESLAYKMKVQGYEVNEKYHGPKHFNVTRKEVGNTEIPKAYSEIVELFQNK